MILNTTYLDKEKERIIDELVGSKLSFWQSITIGRGSHRMILDEYSDVFIKFLKPTSNLLYGNIEMREKGIFIRIAIKNYETISWLIPYYKLSIFNSKHFSIHSDGSFLKFRRDSKYTMNLKFIKNLLNFKAQYSLNLSFK
ncbi:MAG: hypothetical protein CBD51_004965 [Flavobacteriales bacterium TMED191]|nr:MAG: hypothetical protein CBD51_004965 [Flavobacteriales bacterium TMED191]